jgi:hypothetical protein
MSILQRNTTLILAMTAFLALPLLFSAAGAGGPDVQELDLSELADGETRVLGDERRVEATRDGNRVTLRLLSEDGDEANTIVLDRTMDCDLDEEDCTVMIGPAGAGQSMFVLRKSGEDGEGASRVERHVEIVTGDGDGRSIAIQALPHVRVLKMDADGTRVDLLEDLDLHLEDLDVHLEGLDEALENVRVLVPPVMIHAGPGETVLRCPEGDVTMTVTEDEEDDGYLCPKHSVELKPFERPRTHGFRWHMSTEEKDDGDGTPEI